MQVYLFNLRSFDQSLPLGRPLYSVSLSSVSQHTELRSKLPLTHLSINTRDTRNRDREKTSDQTHLYNERQQKP